MNDIPRYKASMPMQTVFVTNADGCGDHIFTQVSRKGNVAIYRRNKVSDGSCQGYETIVIKTVKAGTVYAKGATPTVADTESYPGAQSFGKLGWSYPSLGAAEAKMEELTKVKVEETVDEEPNTVPAILVPSGLFNLLQFAEANNFPVTKETADKLTALLRVKICRYVKNETVNGRSIQLFTKV